MKTLSTALSCILWKCTGWRNSCHPSRFVFWQVLWRGKLWIKSYTNISPKEWGPIIITYTITTTHYQLISTRFANWSFMYLLCSHCQDSTCDPGVFHHMRHTAFLLFGCIHSQLTQKLIISTSMAFTTVGSGDWRIQWHQFSLMENETVPTHTTPMQIEPMPLRSL